jgi:hypothetical protein
MTAEPRPSVPRCRECGQPIRWARTERGRTIPLDRDPVPNGNLVLLPVSGEAVHLRAGAAVEPGTLRYVSHFATCPQAGLFRTPKRNRYDHA